MKRLMRYLAVVSALAFVSGAALGATTLRYTTNFNAAAGAEWTADSIAIDTDNGPDELPNFATVADGATLEITDNDYGNVWFICYAKMTDFAADSHPDALGAGATSAAFFLGDDGILYANSNQTWTSVQTGLSTNGTQWLGIAVHLDYTAEAWDIYTTTNYNTAMTKQNSSPLAMNTGADNNDLTNVVVDGSVSLDDVIVDMGISSVDASSFADMNIYDGSSEPTGVWIASTVPDHSFTAGENSLAMGEALGQELAAGLSNLSYIRFYQNGAEQIYQISGLPTLGSWALTEGTVALADQKPAAGEAMWVRYATAPSANIIGSVLFNPAVRDVANFSQDSEVITLDPAWTPRTWTSATGREPSAAGLNLGAVGVGAQLYIIPQGTYRFEISEMKASGSWYPARTLYPNALMWIKRNGAGSGSWTISE